MLIKTIEEFYNITLSMENAVNESKFTVFELLINTRQELMKKIDEYRANNPHYQYSPQEKKLLEEILRIDQSLTPKLQEQMDETRSNLNQIRKTKEISKKYQPYIKQIYGAFIDRKK